MARQKKQRLYIYDFDDTIIRTPGPECYRPMQKAGMAGGNKDRLGDISKNYLDWWAMPESADVTNMDIAFLGATLDCHARDRDECRILKQPGLFIVISARRGDVTDTIVKSLQVGGMSIDQVHCAGNGDGLSADKGEIVSRILKSHTGIWYVKMYDDVLTNLLAYRKRLREISETGRMLKQEYMFLDTMCMYDATNYICCGGSREIIKVASMTLVYPQLKQ